MARTNKSPDLNDEQKQNFCAYVSAGCDRETAAKLAHSTQLNFLREMSRDDAFAAEVRHAEGAGELAHLHNVQKAAEDPKNWRVSVWWLERHSPERFGRRSAGTVTTAQLKAFVAQLVAIVIEELPDSTDHQRLVERFDQLIQTLDQLILSHSGAHPETRGTAEIDPFENDASAFDDQA